MREVYTYPREHTREYTDFILFIFYAIDSGYHTHISHISRKSYRRYFTCITHIGPIGSSKEEYTASCHNKSKYDSTKIYTQKRDLYIRSHEEVYYTDDRCHPDNDTRLLRMTANIGISERGIFFGKQEQWSKKKIAYHGIYAILFEHSKGLRIRIYPIILQNLQIYKYH